MPLLTEGLILVYRVHWLRSKALRDRWEEEAELLASEVEWTGNFFDYKARRWQELIGNFPQGPADGQRCYAAKQQSIFMKLHRQCRLISDDPSVITNQA